MQFVWTFLYLKVMFRVPQHDMAFFYSINIRREDVFCRYSSFCLKAQPPIPALINPPLQGTEG